MKKFLPFLLLIPVFLFFPLAANASIFDLLGSIFLTILCLITGIACPDPCLQLVSITGGTAAFQLCHLVDRIGGALYAIGWSLALVVLLIGGISYMVSGGDEEKVKNAKKIITSGLIGTAIVLCAGFILSLLVQFLSPLFF